MACLLLLSVDRGVFCFASRSRVELQCVIHCLSWFLVGLFFLFSGREAPAVESWPWSPSPGPPVPPPTPLSCVGGFLVLFLVATERETLGTRSLSSGSADDRNMTPLLPWNSVHDVFFWFLPSPRIRAVRGDDGAPLLPGGQVTKGGA